MYYWKTKSTCSPALSAHDLSRQALATDSQPPDPQTAMSKDDDYPHSVLVNDKGKKEAERAAALLNLKNWLQAASLGLKLVLDHAEASVKGQTEIVYCTPEIQAMLKSNQKFIEALCEEGVVEWLTPFVLTKSKQGGIAQSTTDTTNQP